MNPTFIKNLLHQVHDGALTIEAALERLKHFPAEQTSSACIDHQRTMRTGIPEVIYGETKSGEQIVEIARAMLAQQGPVMATRIDPDKATLVRQALPEMTYDKTARVLFCRPIPTDSTAVRGTIVVVCAGTSDIPVAEEARLTVAILGHPVQTVYDAGVAGLHRLLDKQSVLSEASVIIVAAGMEGALPSVVGGLVHSPVIGVPTSVGYGTGQGGFAALLGILNSCAPGIAAVNIDNGFGAGCMAAAINQKAP